MTTWLESRARSRPFWHRAHGHAHGAGRVLMPGMLTDADMERLAARAAPPSTVSSCAS